MNTYRHLRQWFGALVPLAVLVGTPSKDSARAAAPDAPKPLPTFAHSFCKESTSLEPAAPYEPLQGLKVAGALPDYVALMEHLPFPGRSGFPEPSRWAAASEAGWMCRGSSDRAACTERIRHAEASLVFGSDPQSLGPYGLLVERGNQERVLGTWRELLTFLGPIDSLADAALIATLHRYTIACGFSTGQVRGSGYRLTAQTGEYCGGRIDSHVLDIGRDGSLVVVSSQLQRLPNNCAYGRRPHGFTLGAGAADTPHRLFVQAMQLEHASVEAFHQIGQFLAEHNAPRALIRRVYEAAQDEERHTRDMRRLVARYGTVPALREVTSVPFGELFDLALSNAVEGCVRETFAALLAWEQAEHAQDPVVAAVLSSIADDETAHAALSWDLAAWLETKLTTAQRAHLTVARADCFARLRDEWATPRPPLLRQLAGLPTPARAHRLIAHLERGLPAMQVA